MATSNNFAPNAPVGASSGANDLPPPYSAVVDNPHYGFVVPTAEPIDPSFPYPQPKQFTPTGVYPHPPNVTSAQRQPGPIGPAPSGAVPVGIVLPPTVGTNPTTITCFNCGKIVTTKVTYTTAWHTHLVAGSICVLTM